MRTTAKTIAEPSVCTRRAGGEARPGADQPACVLCVLAELDEEEVVAA